MAEALYRKYRPRVFSDVVGQDTIERTLKNAIGADKVSHAYLFCGPRGTGKTTTARLLAKALLCESGPTPEPDGTCEDCTLIAEGRHPDVYELDAASRTGVENVREEIIGRVSFAPVRGRFKIYIIDEVHMLSTAAFNALLKTLEEPPAHVVFVLCTTDPQKVPETILSRCQRFDFRRISVDSIVLRLVEICVAEGVEFDAEALDLIAQRADGGMRNALTSLEQLIAFGEGTVTMEGAESMLGSMDTSALADIVGAIGRRDVAACFRWTADYVESGADLAQFTRDLTQHMRDMYVIALGADEAVDLSDAMRRALTAQLKLFGTDRLARLLSVLGDLSQELKTSTNPRLSFEIALTRMAVPEADLTLAGLAERIERLERAEAVGGTGAAPVAAPTAEPFDDDPWPAPVASTPRTNTIERPAPAPVSESETVGRPTPAPTPAAPTAAEEAREAAEVSAQDAARERLWQAAMSALRSASAAYGVLFMNATAKAIDADGALVIEFPAENTFAFKAAQGADVQTALTEALRSAGSERPFRLVQAKDGGNAPKPAVQPSVTAPESRTATPAPAPEPQRPAAPVPTEPVHTEPVHAESVHTERPRVVNPEPAPVPSDDEVPLSVYEAEGFDFAADAAPTVRPQTRREQQPRPQPQPQPQPQSQPQPAVEPKPQTPNKGAGELDQWLVAGFGEGIRFEEVPPS